MEFHLFFFSFSERLLEPYIHSQLIKIFSSGCQSSKIILLSESHQVHPQTSYYQINIWRAKSGLTVT